MKFSISVRTSIILFFGLASSLNKVQASLTQASDATSDISLVEFQGLLYSEVNGEIKAVQEQVDETVAHSHDRRLHGRFLREEDVSPTAQELWNKVIQHGWDMSQTSSNNYYNGQQTPKKRNLGEIDGVKTFPFLVCSHSSVYKSGFQRMEPMLERTGAHSGDASVVFNDPKKTCFHVSLTHEAALELRDDSTAGEDTYYTIAPMTDLMKIQVETMKEITNGSWTVPKTQSPEDWERLIRVGLSNGHRMSLSEDDVKAMANDILEDIQLLGQAGAVRRRRRLQEGVDSDDSMSLSNMFSVTSSRNDAGTRQLRRNKKAAQTPGRLHNWNRALELGLEADHSCRGMFDTLTVNVHHRNDGFDIVLNPRIRAHNHNDAIEEAKQKNGKTDEINDHSSHDDGIEKKTDEKGIEHSASNHNCVASLIMALSTHPSVKSIETDGHIMTSDFEAQWITQSRSEGKLPLRDLGIDGTNQIISIIDSGLDINHSYFGPTDAGVFDVSTA
jgi:hypothetical protein